MEGTPVRRGGLRGSPTASVPRAPRDSLHNCLNGPAGARGVRPRRCECPRILQEDRALPTATDVLTRERPGLKGAAPRKSGANGQLTRPFPFGAQGWLWTGRSRLEGSDAPLVTSR